MTGALESHAGSCTSCVPAGGKPWPIKLGRGCFQFQKGAVVPFDPFCAATEAAAAGLFALSPTLPSSLSQLCLFTCSRSCTAGNSWAASGTERCNVLTLMWQSGEGKVRVLRAGAPWLGQMTPSSYSSQSRSPLIPPSPFLESYCNLHICDAFCPCRQDDLFTTAQSHANHLL